MLFFFIIICLGITFLFFSGITNIELHAFFCFFCLILSHKYSKRTSCLYSFYGSYDVWKVIVSMWRLNYIDHIWISFSSINKNNYLFLILLNAFNSLVDYFGAFLYSLSPFLNFHTCLIYGELYMLGNLISKVKFFRFKASSHLTIFFIMNIKMLLEVFDFYISSTMLIMVHLFWLNQRILRLQNQ